MMSSALIKYQASRYAAIQTSKTSSFPPHPATVISFPCQPRNTQYHVQAVKSSTAQVAKGENDDVERQRRRRRRIVMRGAAASLGLVLIMMGIGHDKALALGPEGPLMEEFWENVRRYGLYALTVSTGVLYSVFQPIYELLKNPISAILVLIIIGGTFYIGSQVLSAMVGISDFDYQYAY